MRFGSVCSGIEAASVAWHPIGWRAEFLSEIEPFPCAVLAHHYPNTPNLGDMTKFKEWPDAAINVLVGGTPCQSFSVAGLRKGLDDPRGSLMLTYLAIARRYRPAWVVWENVPGVLSSNGGRDFGTLLGGMAELGYGFAYRILDAQYVRVESHARAVPQRRRRVFVVGHLGDWRRAAAVLFERESLCWNPAPRREAGKEVTGTLSSRTKGGGGLGTDFDCDGVLISSTGDVSHCLNAGGMGRQDYETETLVAHSLRGEGFDASQCASASEHITPTLDKYKTPAVAVALRGRECDATAELGDDVGNALRASQGGGDKSHVLTGMAVRRLTPVECERLQGFPDDYTLITHRSKPAADGPRYKALGNSMAVNVMRWIGERIAMVNEVTKMSDAA